MDSGFVDRMIRAARLDPALYEEVEADEGANVEAAGVVALAAIAAGIGAGGSSLVGLGVASSLALFGWAVWALLTWLIGTRLLPEPTTRASYGELLRAIAFSSAPGVIRFLGLLPGLRELVFFVSGVWMLVAMIVAVRQALDYRSVGRAVAVCLIGWLVQIALLAAAFAFLRTAVERVP